MEVHDYCVEISGYDANIVVTTYREQLVLLLLMVAVNPLDQEIQHPLPYTGKGLRWRAT